MCKTTVNVRSCMTNVCVMYKNYNYQWQVMHNNVSMVSVRSSTIQCQYQVIYSNCQYYVQQTWHTQTRAHTHTHTTHMQKAYLSDNCCQPSLAHIPMDSDHFRNRKFHPELDNGTAWYNPHQKGMVDKLKKPRAIRPNKQNTCAYRYSSIWQSNSGDEPKSQAQVN